MNLPVSVSNSRKIALLIGIEYLGTENQLVGCTRDVINMYNVLVDTLGVLPSDIVMLTEQYGTLPTKRNILYAIHELAKKSKDVNAQETIIYYSGHGTQVPGYENDRKDEALVPLDVNNGLILDNTLRKYLDEMPNSTLCITIFDCCNSASIGDLPYHFKYNNYNKNCSCVKDIGSNYPNSTNSVFCISGCKDNGVSNVVKENGVWESALTNAIIKIFKTRKETITYFQLIQYLTDYMTSERLSQRPVLSTSWSTSPGKLITNKRDRPSVKNISSELQDEIAIISHLS